MSEEEKLMEKGESNAHSLQSYQDLNDTIDSDEEKEVEDRPLNKEEIDKAYEIINDKYPLNYLSVLEVLSLHKLFSKWSTPKEEKLHSKKMQEELVRKAIWQMGDKESLQLERQDSEDTSLTNAINDAKHENDEMLNRNPLNLLGLGIIAQFALTKYLIWAFTLFSVFSIPIMVFYSQYDSMRGRPGAFGTSTLANFGFASSTCYSTTRQLDSIIMFCNTGRFDTEPGSFGIVPYNAEDRNVCINGVGASATCQEYVSQDFLQQYNTKCAGEQFCILEDLTNYFIPTAPAECLNDQSIFFVNTRCLQDIDTVNEKRFKAHIIVTICILVSLLFLIFLYFSKQKLKITAVNWDLTTITAGDYTVSKPISRTEFQRFKSTHNEDTDPIIFQYMEFLKSHYETEISAEQRVNKDEEIKIANISFSFDNDEIIKLLVKRGSAITNLKMEDKKQAEEEIDRVKAEQYQEMVTPVKAFITFETQEGYERAIRMKHNEKKVFKPTVEPTNIIWENTRFTKRDKFIRTLVVVGIIILLMVLTFFMFILIKRGLVSNTRRYLNLNCDNFNSQIETREQGLKFAMVDFQSFYGDATETKMSGALQCFCSDFYNNNGISRAMSEEFTVNIEGRDYTERLCRQFAIDRIKAPIISTSVSIIIVLLNYILREVIIALCKRIGFHTESHQTKVIMIFIFIVQFFNTAIVNLITNMDIREAIGITFISGTYPDFNFAWYLDFAVPLITTMLINAFSPIIDFAIFYGLLVFFRLLDKNFKCKKYKTKKKTIQQFVNLYAGPEYLIHYKYARVLNIVFVTFMYGMILPVLFPIALVSLIISYFVEKLSIVYYYKEPPSYDSKLNDTALKILAWAPFLTFTFGYWMMSNKQIFENRAELSAKANPSVEPTGHVIFRDISPGHDFNLFLMVWIFLFGVIFNLLFRFIWKKKLLTLDVTLGEDENLPNYFDALSGENLLYLATEEKYARNVLGYRKLPDSVLDKIENSKTSKRTIQGCAMYDMLANTRYVEKFQYLTVLDRGLDKEKIEDCDKVNVSLNLAYIRQQESERVTLRSRFKSTIRQSSRRRNTHVEDKLDRKITHIRRLMKKVDKAIKHETLESTVMDEDTDSRLKEKLL